MSRRSIIAALAASFTALVLHCVNLAGGGGSEWEAKITGRAEYDGSGLPVAGARVVICPERFLRDTSGIPDDSTARALRETVTDKEGFFSADRLEPGVVHIEINDKQSWGSLSECEISGNSAGRAIACVLKPIGRIHGTLAFPAGYQGSAFVQVYGLDRIVRAAPDGSFVLSDIPEGNYTLRVLLSRTEYLSKNVGPVAVATNAETDLGALAVPLNGGAWSGKRRIYLNTSVTGANVAGDVVDFPVLVRLNSGNFDFSQAQATGADIRFTKSDTTLLPCEIERWDPAIGAAEIWVKVDTVQGNDSTQSITMYWGNPDASSTSNGPSVFDTTAGFAGVWHLGESSGGIHDATDDRFDGTRNGNPTRIAGDIGYAQSFSGSGDFIEMGNVCNPDTSGFTVCAWIKPALVNSNQTIVSKSHGGSPSSSYGWLLELDNTGGLMAFIATGAGSWGASRTFVLGSTIQIVDSTVWHHIAAVFVRSGNDKCRLYIDGTEVSSLPAGGDITSLSAVVNSAPLRLGADANGGCPWKGSMDECSVSLTVRSPDWIRLCYMNQKQNDKMVILR